MEDEEEDIGVSGSKISEGEKETDQSGTESRWSTKIISEKEDLKKRRNNFMLQESWALDFPLTDDLH